MQSELDSTDIYISNESNNLNYLVHILFNEHINVSFIYKQSFIKYLYPFDRGYHAIISKVSIEMCNVCE